MTKSKETLLTHIIEDLRATVPVNAEAPEEKIIIPGDIEEVFIVFISLYCIKLFYMFCLLKEYLLSVVFTEVLLKLTKFIYFK